MGAIAGGVDNRDRHFIKPYPARISAINRAPEGEAVRYFSRANDIQPQHESRPPEIAGMPSFLKSAN
jgi:hypothetical protein